MMRLMSSRIRLHFVCAVGFKSSHSNASPRLQLGSWCSRNGASLCLRHERVKFFHRLFLFFFWRVSSKSERVSTSQGLSRFSKEALSCGMTP
jgi:hypothetical protein